MYFVKRKTSKLHIRLHDQLTNTANLKICFRDELHLSADYGVPAIKTAIMRTLLPISSGQPRVLSFQPKSAPIKSNIQQTYSYTTKSKHS